MTLQDTTTVGTTVDPTAFMTNPILDTDSYKLSHWEQYPPGSQAMFSYIEARGGHFPRTIFFGLQMLLKQRLSKRITHAMVDEAKTFYEAHGVPFNEKGWRYLVERYNGLMPVTIRAAAEGEAIPIGNVLVTVECHDRKLFWLASHLETSLLRVWYPTTVATQSWHIREIIRKHLEATCENPQEQLPFKLHDFGSRGVSSPESAAIGGAAHLVSFQGSDTVLGIVAANYFYNEQMAAFSVPASEHSTITSWGRSREREAYRNMVVRYAKPGAIFSCVSDSYDLFAAIEMWGEQREDIERSGATLVIRPDSGDPLEIIPKAIERIEALFGSTTNALGFRVLNHVRILQGDGVNAELIDTLLSLLAKLGYSAENIVFGMGGALLQRVDRDTMSFAMKCSAIQIDGVWCDVRKDPITDSGKRSKAGRLTLRRHVDGRYATVLIDSPMEEGWTDAMEVVFDHGVVLADVSLRVVRQRAQKASDVEALARHARLDPSFT